MSARGRSTTPGGCAGGAVTAALFCLLLTTAAGAARAETPAPGEYVTEHGWGTLRVSSRPGGNPAFTILSVGSNMHTCELEGAIGDGRASLEADEGKRCIVDFVTRSDGIEVTGSDACRYFCGARASFDGLYLKVPEGCSGRAQTEARKSFKRLYDAKRYVDARATLEPLLARCVRFLDRLEEGWVRNDLALTQHKLGDDGACRQTLAPLAADAAKSDEEIGDAFPPSDVAAYLPIVKATRTNLKLCGAGGKR